MMILLRYIYSRWFVDDKCAKQDLGSSYPELLCFPQGVIIKNHKKNHKWRIQTLDPDNGTIQRRTKEEHFVSCVHYVPYESTADILTQQLKAAVYSSWALCPFLPIETGLFYLLVLHHRFKLQLFSLVSFKAVCISVYTSECTQTHIYILCIYHIYLCMYAYIIS